MVNRPKDKRELVHAYRTEGILVAARKVIAKRGFDNATMGEVAKAAGISKATIYLYFKNKESLYFHCVVDKIDELIKVIKEEIQGLDDPLELLRTIIESQVRHAEKDKDFLRVFLTEKMTIFLDNRTEFGREYYKRHIEYTEILSGALTKGMKRGVIKEMDPDKSAQMLFSMLRGMALMKIMTGDESPLIDDVGMIMDVFINGVGKR